MSYLTDPRVFNYFILIVYALNSARWAIAGSWGDCLYWLAAFQITFAVTFGFHRT